MEIKEQMETSINNGKSTVRMETGGTRRNQMRTREIRDLGVNAISGTSEPR